MKTRVEDTIKRHNVGMNCAQAVACTYCDLVGADELTTFKMTEGMGLGMGSMLGTCGAVSGAAAILGMLNSTGNLEAPDSKGSTYKLTKELTARFQEQNGALACKDLKGVETGKMLRSCPDCIKDAAAILEDILTKAGIE